ncbi:MAG TPA: polynucleotide adenylyltransferase PcnB [Gammaproteobacteria bacterium]|nr:polynucleotide adenylyltransferase PcnB [Gammaproteobacteria bacterium]
MDCLRAMNLLRLSMSPKNPQSSSEIGQPENATVVQSAEHNINPEKISANALKVLDALTTAGFEAYLVGGGVRDLLLGLSPKDFDIATSASPEEIKPLFRNCRLIGRRFRLAHVVFGREVIEVATFRADHGQGEGGESRADGRIVRDNVFGTVEEDALRRDFTINALYYANHDAAVLDFVGALEDIKSRTLRLIGEPDVRVKEDPVRCLRAARFSAKLGFDVATDVRQAMTEHAHLLRDIPPARLFEEVLKLFHSGHAVQSFDKLREFDLLQYLFPVADDRLKRDDARFEAFVYQALQNTDDRIAEGKPVTPAFLYAVMLWPQVEKLAQDYLDEEPPVTAILRAADSVVTAQMAYTSLPKRFSVPMREIWAMQPRLERYQGKRALHLLRSARFRAGYDFLLLRSHVDSNLRERADWWTKTQESHPVEPDHGRRFPRTRSGKSSRSGTKSRAS